MVTGPSTSATPSTWLHHGVFSESPVGARIARASSARPGYPFFLTVLEAIGGRHAALVQGAQFALVAATSVLVGLIGRAVSADR